jgi:hypothetical protein
LGSAVSRSGPTQALPAPGFNGRKHTYTAASDDAALELAAVSPGCPCRDCVALRVKQNRSSER